MGSKMGFQAIKHDMGMETATYVGRGWTLVDLGYSWWTVRPGMLEHHIRDRCPLVFVYGYVSIPMKIPFLGG
jgi:hypothetical protein